MILWGGSPTAEAKRLKRLKCGFDFHPPYFCKQTNKGIILVKLYKLTNRKYQTLHQTQWGKGKVNKARDKGKGYLCTSYYIHAYRHPLLAAFFRHCHGYEHNFPDLVFWEAEGKISISDKTKVGCKSLKTVRIIPLLNPSLRQFRKLILLVYRSTLSFVPDWLDSLIYKYVNDKRLNNHDRTSLARFSYESHVSLNSKCKRTIVSYIEQMLKNNKVDLIKLAKRATQ
jgi:hypothetical protein